MIPLLLLLTTPPKHPAVRLKDGDGKVHVLFADRKAPATVVIVGIPDCPIAQEYVPTLNLLAAKFKKRGVQFAFAIVDPWQKMGDLKKFSQSYRLSFPVLGDPQQLVVKLTKAKAVPTAAVFDRDGTLKYVGCIDDRYPTLGVRRNPRTAYLDSAIASVVDHRQPKPAKTNVIGCLIPHQTPESSSVRERAE